MTTAYVTLMCVGAVTMLVSCLFQSKPVRVWLTRAGVSAIVAAIALSIVMVVTGWS